MLKRMSAIIVFMAIAVLPLTGAAATVTSVEMVPMADGVKLSTAIMLPKTGSGPWPVVLIRTQYDKNNFTSVGAEFQAHGMVAVVQDTRGRSGSEGVDCIFRCDEADGLKTIEWIKSQSWCNGKLAMWGMSAMGIDSYVIAPDAVEGMKTMWVQHATGNMFDWMFRGGAFREKDVTDWLGLQSASDYVSVLGQHHFLDDWWGIGQTSTRYGQVQIPIFHQSGWYDMFGQDTIEVFQGFQNQGGAGAKGLQKLIIGPWTHIGVGSPIQGEMTFPANSALPLTDIMDQWLEHFLDVQPDPVAIAKIPAVQYYVMGDVDTPGAPGLEWRSADTWPVPSTPVRLYMHSGGKMDETCPAQGTKFSYTYNPADPTPTAGGGNLFLDSGPMDQHKTVEKRKDVVIFSKAVAEPLEVTGRVRAHVWLSIDQPDTDLVIRLTDVYPDGRSMLITDGDQRLAAIGRKDGITLVKPGEVFEAVFDLPSTSIVINKTHKLRAIIASANYPRYRANPNDGTSLGETSSPRPVKVTIYSEPGRMSYLEIPVPGADPSSVNYCTTPAGTDGGQADGGGESAGGCGCSVLGL
jgi:predicted acyl esterase